MIVDASAILAVYLKENDAEHFARLMLNAETLYMSAPSYVELCLAAASKRGAQAVDDIDAQLALWDVEIIAFDQHASKLAVSAFLRYGKGRAIPPSLTSGIAWLMPPAKLRPCRCCSREMILVIRMWRGCYDGSKGKVNHGYRVTSPLFL